MKLRWICLIVLVLLVVSMPACLRDAKSKIVGKWEATITVKRTGNGVQVMWEFLPDGTYTVAALDDATMNFDKDKYTISPDGLRITLRSQLVNRNNLFDIDVNTMIAETPEELIKFKKL